MRVIFFSILLSVCGLAFLLPDLLLRQNLSFFTAHDLEVPFHGSFLVLSNFYSGGVQLWNQFDQINLSVMSLSFGVYNISNVLTSFFYVVLSSWVDRGGELFYKVYSITHLLWPLIIRTIGGYLLLRHLCFSRLITIIALIYLNLILALPMTLGLGVNFLYSFLPLVLFFILKWFQFPSLKNFFVAVLSITLAISQSPLIGLSYFYTVIHFFILGCVVVCFRPLFESRMSRVLPVDKDKQNSNLKWAAVCLLLMAAIMLPNFWYIASLQQDFYIPGSGLSGTEGRLKRFFDLGYYFTRDDAHWAPFTHLLERALDYKTNEWWISWPFLGLSTLFFAGAGLITWRNPVKYVFVFAIVSIVFLNSPREGTEPWVLAHWINVLTNPFSPLFRGAHMSGLLAISLLLPLIAAGVSFVLRVSSSNKDRGYSVTLGILLLFTLALLWFGLGEIVYVAISGSLILTISVLLIVGSLRTPKAENSNRKSICQSSLILVIGLMLIEIFFLRTYVENERYGLHRSIENLTIRPIDKTGEFSLAYQNPELIPFRPYIRAHSEFPRSWGLHSGEQTMYGQYYRFTPLTRYLGEPDLYKATPREYAALSEHDLFQHYLERNPRIFDFYQSAVSSDSQNIEELITNGTDWEIISVDFAEAKNSTVSESVSSLEDLTPDQLSEFRGAKSVDVEQRVFALNLQSAQVKMGDSLDLYSFNLPKDFPEHFGSDRLTAHRKNWDVRVDGHKLTSAQGRLIRPFTYDVGNITTKKLVIALPHEFSGRNDEVILKLEMPPYISNVWKNQNDKVGVTFNAPRDGWVRVHYPFSEKWQILVDNDVVDYYRANKMFIAFRIKKGINNIELQYWPHTSLRVWINVSMLAMFGALALLLVSPALLARKHGLPTRLGIV